MDYYGDNGNARSERAFSVAGRYVDNIYRTRQAQRDARPMRKGDRQAERLASERLNGRQYDRNIYMGNSNG